MVRGLCVSLQRVGQNRQFRGGAENFRVPLLRAAACGLRATQIKARAQTGAHHRISSRSESAIHADAQPTRFNAMFRTGEHKRTIIQIEVEIFRSGSPVRHQRDLDAGRPAGAGPRFRYAGGVLGRQGSVGKDPPFRRTEDCPWRTRRVRALCRTRDWKISSRRTDGPRPIAAGRSLRRIRTIRSAKCSPLAGRQRLRKVCWRRSLQAPIGIRGWRRRRDLHILRAPEPRKA